MKAETSQPILIVVIGPTASGKTDFAIELANFFNTEIISTDSRQVYKEISIGTAKPSEEQLGLIPHHFINHCSIHDSYNAGTFEKEALLLLGNLFEKHNVVIAAGGTGLYIKAICEGLDDLPLADKVLRGQLLKELEGNGVDFLFNKLEQLDPEGSKTIDPKNPHRIMRAIEIVRSKGKSLSRLKKHNTSPRAFKIVKVRIDVERSLLYSRIDNRVEDMIRLGLVKEAEGMLPQRHLNALNTVGYTELFDYFEGKYSLPEAIDKIKQHTRNYAKRQITWFRKESGVFSQREFKPESVFDKSKYF